MMLAILSKVAVIKRESIAKLGTWIFHIAKKKLKVALHDSAKHEFH